MIEKIKSTSDLPEWFTDRNYKTKLSKADWFREVRTRQIVADFLSRAHLLQNGFTEKNRKFFLSKLDPPPHPALLFPRSPTRPVRDLTAEEVIYLKAAMNDDDLRQFSSQYDELLLHWHKANEEDPDGPTPLFGKYEERFAKFIDDIEDNPLADKLDQSAENFLKNLGHPWLGYSGPLNGSAITIDTQFDDETILEFVKRWLAEKRAQDGQRLRRPFSQNDFDDWERFKIRQIFDLEVWSTVMNVQIYQRVIAQFLWPDASDDFSPIDVLRTTARKKANDIFKSNVGDHLYCQLLIELGENFLDE